MSNRYIETSFLYILLFSFLLHIAGGFLIYCLTGKIEEPQKEPVFIDLQQIQEPILQQQKQNKIERTAERSVRVLRETAPRSIDTKDSGKLPAKAQPQINPQKFIPSGANSQSLKPYIPLPRNDGYLAPESSRQGLFRKKTQSSQGLSHQQLFPGANRLAKLEENYRRKYENEIAEGDTKFLNSDDIQFGSFLRRFENSVYGVWRYPQEAAMKGIEGIVPVRITFNRKGEIANIQQLESSGAKILDEEVLRTLRAIGPMGAFPKGYDKEEFHLIAFFQYGGTRRSLR